MAPEVFFCEANSEMTYDYRVDLWSFGITLIEMAEMDPPYHEMRPERVGAKIRQATPPTLKNPSKWSEEFSSFLTCCLKRNPNERLAADQLQKHPFLSNGKSFHSSILFLIEEFKTVPTVELVEEETTPIESRMNGIENTVAKTEEEGQSDDSFTDEEEEVAVVTNEAKSDDQMTPNPVNSNENVSPPLDQSNENNTVKPSKDLSR